MAIFHIVETPPEDAMEYIAFSLDATEYDTLGDNETDPLYLLLEQEDEPHCTDL